MSKPIDEPWRCRVYGPPPSNKPRRTIDFQALRGQLLVLKVLGSLQEIAEKRAAKRRKLQP